MGGVHHVGDLRRDTESWMYAAVLMLQPEIAASLMQYPLRVIYM